MLLHVWYFISIMLFFPISLLLPHSEPGYDWWWGEILVCCCGDLYDRHVAMYCLFCSHISCLVVLCGKHLCWHRTHRCHWLLFPCLGLPSPCCWEFSRPQQTALFVVCWKQEEGQCQSKSTRPGISCAELILAIGEENYIVQPWQLDSQKLRELLASSQLM